MNQKKLSPKDHLFLALPHLNNIDLRYLDKLNPWFEENTWSKAENYQFEINDQLDSIEIEAQWHDPSRLLDSPIYLKLFEEAYDKALLPSKFRLLNSRFLNPTGLVRAVGLSGELKLEGVAEQFRSSPIFKSISQWVVKMGSAKLNKVKICNDYSEKQLTISFHSLAKPIKYLSSQTDELLESINVPKFGHTLQILCDNFNLKKWNIQLSFTPSELIKAELLFPNPTRKFQLFMHSYNPEHSDKKLAIIEAALGVETPNTLSYGYGKKRWNSTYLYDLNT